MSLLVMMLVLSGPTQCHWKVNTTWAQNLRLIPKVCRLLLDWLSQIVHAFFGNQVWVLSWSWVKGLLCQVVSETGSSSPGIPLETGIAALKSSFLMELDQWDPCQSRKWNRYPFPFYACFISCLTTVLFRGRKTLHCTLVPQETVSWRVLPERRPWRLQSGVTATNWRQ